MTLEERCKSIRSRDDFVAFIDALERDLRENPSGWENVELSRYLRALAAWVRDMRGYYLNQGQPIPEQPDWQVAANMMLAAKMYE
jgi:hypothetical protein